MPDHRKGRVLFMDNTVYGYVVYGATVAGCAAALSLAARGQRVLLIEPGGVIGCDYVSAYRGDGRGFFCRPATAAGEDFKDELCRRGALNEHGEHLPAVAPVLCRRLCESTVVTLCRARIADGDLAALSGASGGEPIGFSVFTTGGWLTLSACRFIDMRADADVLRAHTLNAVLSIPPEDGAPLPDGVIRGALPGEGYASFAVPQQLSLREAKRWVYEHRFAVASDGNGILIDCIAEAFDFDSECRNAVEAFDSGAALAARLLGGGDGNE